MKNGIVSVFLGIFFSSSASLSAQMQSPSDIGQHLNNYTLKTTTLPNGVRLQFAEQGDADGKPVIFLHGLSDSWHSFEKVLPLLPPNIHAFAVTQRGHGDSDHPLTGYTPKDFASDIAAFTRLMNLESAVIVGHSMGGMIAQQFALDYPGLTKAVVINSSAASLKDNPGLPEFYEQVLELNDPMDKAFMDEFQKSTLAKPIDSAYYNLLVAEGLKVPVRVFKAALTGLMNADYTKELKNIKVPVLIMWGTKDGIFSRTNIQLLVQEIRDARLLVYEGTGHALHWEEPVRFVNDLVGFVTKSIH
ncbi:MAG: alpha/beta fold hydrolase [Chitinophagaceae bacterium]